MADEAPAEVTGNELILRHTGEIIDLDNARECALALHRVRALEASLRDAKAMLTDAIAAECSRQGTKTLDFEGLKAELKPTVDTVWDIEVLEELRLLGLPEERFNELVTAEVQFKVNAAVAKQIAGANDMYAEVIGRAKTTAERGHYVSLRAQR